MITTQHLKEANDAVTAARNARPFDQTAYDAAHGAYMALIERWRVEGMTDANEARRDIVDSNAARLRLSGKGRE